MVLIEEFSDTPPAEEAQEILLRLGISSRLAADPLSSRAPALGDFAELGLFVEDVHAEKALAALRSRVERRRNLAS